MITIKDLSEPAKNYAAAKDAYHQNAIEYFDSLVKESNTNMEANKITCESYYAKLKDIENGEKLVKKKKRLKTFLRVLEVLCYILIILIPIGILIHKKIKEKIDAEINDQQKTIEKLNKEAEEIKGEAIKQTAHLNSLFDFNMPGTVFTKTIPLVENDKLFSPEKLQYLMTKYGFSEHKGNDISTVYVQSGSIKGNPFLIEQNYVQEMGDFTYTGTLLIHWTETVHDSNGHTHTVHRSQTLVAHVTKPKPFYYLDTWLIYGNGAAPKLTFSRTPGDNKNMSDKELTKFAHKFDKKLSKMTKKDITFTKMANTKFEGLFNALDRDNEVEFRLLFTPLAQQNMIDLIRQKDPYGDDFIFYKKKELNFIKTNHSQGFDYSSDPAKFINFDAALAKEAFVNYCDDYFTRFYFDLAPLLCIPLYQNYKAPEFIYKDNHKERVTSFEVESIANKYDKNIFAHPSTATEVILKSDFVKRDGASDLVNITAHSFKGIPHTDLVPTLGGDGHMHMVPVNWTEYVRVSKITPFSVKNINKSRYEYLSGGNSDIKNVYYQKGLVASLLNSKNN